MTSHSRLHFEALDDRMLASFLRAGSYTVASVPSIRRQPNQSTGSRTRPRARLVLEELERRLSPAVILWDGGPTATGTDWNDPANWTGDLLPGPADDAQIGSTFAGITVMSSSDVSIRSITSAAAVQVTAGTFALGAAESQIDAALTVSAGGTLRLDGATLNGTGTLTNSGHLESNNGGTLNIGANNQAVMEFKGGNRVGSLSNVPGGTVRVQGTNFDGNALLTVASGFSNQGTIDLTGEAGFSSQLTVSSGTLLNTGTINVLMSGNPLGGGSRTLDAQLDNQGTLVVQKSLTMSKVGAAQTNSGTITVTGGDLSVGFPGPAHSFTNTGTITIADGRTLTVISGTFSDSGTGSVSGAGTLALGGVTATFDTGISVATLTGSDSTISYTPDLNTTTTTLSFLGTIFTSPGVVNNAADKTLTLTSSILNAGLFNQGLLLANGSSALNGSVGNAPGGTLRVEGTRFLGPASLTVANGFSNQGTIELTSEHGFTTQMAVSSGTLINEVGGVLRTLPGSGRTLAAQLDNRGTLDLQGDLTLRKDSASHANSGSIRVAGGDLTVSQSGTLPSFTNTGVIDVAANRTFSINSAGLTNDGSGILTGDPAGVFAIGGNLLGQSSNADRFAPPGTVSLAGGPGGPAPDPQLLEVMGQDRGNVAAGFTNNFVIGTLSLNNLVRLVDNADNSPGTAPEALYVNTLIVPAGATLDLNHLSLYARAVQIDGTVVGGTINQPTDGGPSLNAPTPGTIGLTGEVDEWTFFGRAGRAVTVVVNPGTTGVPSALAPILGFADVRVLSPDGTVLAAASSTSLGQVVTLAGVPLPAEGIYRVQVRAAPEGNRGNYILTVGDATVDTMPLLLNQQITGVLETPFSLDHWTFAAGANQQVLFDWMNASPTSINFKLTGPAGFTGFSGLTGDSGPVTLPADGTYVLEASAIGGSGGSYAFRLMNTGQTELALGTPFSGTLAGSGQAQLFRVNVPAGQQLRVVLDDGAPADRNELYAQFGAPPTRADFQFSATAAAADQELFVPSAAPGSWYILLYSEAVPAPGTFTLTAMAGDIFLTAVTPDHHANNADMVLTLTGAGFDHTTVVELVDAGGTVFPANSISVDLPTQLTATFAANSLPAWTYSVRARRPAVGAAVLPAAFRAVGGGQARLETHLVLPSFVGRHTQATIYVEYANTGDAAMPAPLLVVHGSDRAFLTLDQHRLVAGFWTSAVPDGFSDTVQILASGATPGVLQPGEHFRVPVYFAGLQQPWDFNDPSVDFNLTSLDSGNTTLIDWPSLETELRPPGIGADAWTPIYANLTAQIGDTWGGFARMLADNAQYLGRLGQHVVDVSRLWFFEVQHAIGLSPLTRLADVTDIVVEAPGLPISFSRVFSSSIVGRYEQGPLGRGWAWANSWDRSLTIEADGTAVVSGIDGRQRRFEPDSRRPSSYYSQPGDPATLTGLDGGAFRLREPDGFVTHFRGDGRVDFIEDPNGNRITATYTGSQLTRLTHSAGQFLQIAYNAGRIASLTDQAGRTVVYTYDPSGQHLTSVRGIDGQTARYTYSTGAGAAREHALLSAEYPDRTHAFFTYDSQGRLDSTARDGNAERVTFIYDSAGSVTATDTLNEATKFFFDQDGLLAGVEDALGRRTLFGHDSDFNLTSVTDALGQSSRYQYDGRGNLVRATNPVGQVTAYRYTADFNRLASVTDVRGNPLNYGYDNRGNLTSITYAEGSIEHFSPDARGEPDSWTNRRGQLIDYRYNADGRLERKDLPDGTFAEYHYNTRGSLEQAIDPSGTTTLEYLDPHNPDLPTKSTYPNGRFLQYTYQNSRRTQMVDQDGFTVNYLYDPAGRLEFLRDAAGNLIVQYHYDPAGRLQREDKGNGTFTIYQYDAAGQLEHLINNAPDGTVNSRFDYVYDDLGRRTRMTTLDGVWDYIYDGIGELTRAVFTSRDPAAIPNQDLQYVYDDAGNRVRTIINGTATDYLTNNLNQYTQVGTANFAYDLDGNLVARTDAGSTTTYTYNAESRLIGVAMPGETWAYQYDAFNDRSATVHNGQRTEYLIDPFELGNAEGEYGAGGGLIAHYAHGLGLTSRVDVSGMAAYYDFDAIGSTAGLTNPGGTYVNSYNYLPFGESLRSAQTIANPLGFVGQFGVTQESNGLEFMRARFYDGNVGRFTTQDPIGIRGGPNLYGYGGNSPQSFIDPFRTDGDEVIHGGQGTDFIDGRYCHIDLSLLRGPGDLVTPPGNDFFDGGGPSDCPPDWVDAHLYSYASNDPVNEVDPSGLFPSLDLGDLKDGVKWVYRKGKRVVQGEPVFDFHFGSGGSSDTVASGDPNEKTGPAGFGPAQFIAADSALSYRIDFENEATATAPAQRVVVTDPLDANLDPSTFEWTEVGFGDVLLAVPAGSRHFQTTVSLTQNDRTFNVEIELSLDSQVGRLTAVFQSLDPATGLPPDVLTGFLPPEDGTGRGQGHISYRVQARAGLPTGTEVKNIALVTFDVNQPIATNQVDPHDPAAGTDPVKEARNTLDAGAPTSSVLALPALSPGGFAVSWSGQDDAGGSGIGSFDVFVSDNAGPFTPWQTGTTATSAPFTGTDGHTYAFYSVATDNVGHAQATPPAAQAVTRVDGLAPTSNVTPLPATQTTPSFLVSWSGSDGAGGSGIAFFDVYVADNGGPFAPFLGHTAQTSAIFSGQVGHTYAFYSVATDQVGNQQPTPATGQAVTRTPVFQTLLPAAPEDATAVGHATVGGLLAGHYADADPAAPHGIAVVARTGGGRWQYSANNGVTWLPIPANVSPDHALLLPAADWIRYVPKANESGSFDLVFAGWDRTAGRPGQFGDTTAGGGAGSFSAEYALLTAPVTPVNDAPAWTATKLTLTQLPGDTNPPGVSVAGFFAPYVADPDGDHAGVAVVGAGPAAGAWEYSTDGTSWTSFGAAGTTFGPVSITNALLLTGADRVRFVPALGFTGTPALSVAPWDGTQGTAAPDGATQGFAITARGGKTAFGAKNLAASLRLNTAPTLANAIVATFPPAITQGGATPAVSVARLLADADASPDAAGIAVTAAGGGTWQYSRDGGAHFAPVSGVSETTALLLPRTALVRFLSAADRSGAATLGFRAWDGAAGTALARFVVTEVGGSTALSAAEATGTLNVDAVNHAPVWKQVRFALPPVLPATADPPGGAVADVIGAAFTDIDPGTSTGVAVVGATGTRTGHWEFSTDAGAHWESLPAVSASQAVLLSGDDGVRYVPNTGFLGTASLSVRAWDGTTGQDGDTGVDLSSASSVGGQTAYSAALATLSELVAANRAPTAAPGAILTLVLPGMANPAGDAVGVLFAGFFHDFNGDPTGIAVTALTGTANGTWQFSLDGGTTWADFVAVSMAQSRLLSGSDRVRFVPGSGFSGSVTLLGRAWDGSSGSDGGAADLTGPHSAGGTTAFSTRFLTAVCVANTAPALVP